MSSKAMLVIFAVVISLGYASGHAGESTAEIYWKAKLGNTPMPKVLKDSLPLGSNEGTVNLNQNYEHDSFQPAQAKVYEHAFNLDNNAKAQFTAAKIIYKHAVDLDKNGEAELLPKDGRVMFFTEEVLFKAGAKMKLVFTKTSNETKFLPLQVAKSLPIASDKVHIILNQFSVNPKTVAAKYIEKNLKECEEEGVEGEVRYCATSLEGMVDYVTTLNSGKNTHNNNNVKVYSAEVEKNNDIQEYTIQKAVKIGNEEKNLVCHKLRNPYAVFLCHSIRKTDAYVVSLVGTYKQKINALAVCHKDTSSWHPKTLALQLLKMKPGTKPICHFLDGNALLWVRN